MNSSGIIKFMIMFWDQTMQILWSIWEVKFQVQWEKLLASTIGLRVCVAFNRFFFPLCFSYPIWGTGDMISFDEKYFFQLGCDHHLAGYFFLLSIESIAFCGVFCHFAVVMFFWLLLLFGETISENESAKIKIVEMDSWSWLTIPCSCSISSWAIVMNMYI